MSDDRALSRGSAASEFVFLSELERYDAFLRLYHSSDPRDTRALAGLVASRDPMVPLILLQYLEEIPEKRALTTILHLIERGNEVVAKAAMAAYRRSHFPGKPRLLKRLILSRNARACRFAVRTLARAGFVDVLPLILRELPEREGAVRQEMLDALRYLPDKRSIPVLLPLAGSGEEAARFFAVQALGELQARRGGLPADLFLRLSTDASERVRRAALDALHAYPTRKVAELLLAQALDRSLPEDVRERAVRALSAFASPDWARDLVVLAAGEAAPSLRLAVEVAFRGFAPEALRAGLLPLLSDPEAPVRRQAALLLAELCRKDEGVRERLLALWRSSDERDAVELTEALRALGGPDAAAELRAAVSRAPVVAYSAAGALARMRGHGRLLLDIVKDSKTPALVRQAVFSHWAKRGPDPDLAAELEPILLEALASEVINIRYLSLHILGWLPLPGKLGALLTLLADESDPEVVATISRQVLTGLGRDPIPLALALTVHPRRASLMGHAVRLLTAQSWEPALARALLDILRSAPLALLDAHPETFLSVCAHLFSHAAVALQDVWEDLPDERTRKLLLRLLSSFMLDRRRRFPALPLEFLAARCGAADAETRGLWHALLAADARPESLEGLAAALVREPDAETARLGADLMRRALAGAAS